jgi:hypothetical protein
MNIKPLLLASVWLAYSAPSMQAAEHYRFRVAEGTQALAGQELPSNMAELAGKPIMVLIGTEGTKWRWMLNGCPPAKPCEWRIDDRGGQPGPPEEDPARLSRPWDVGLTRIDATRFRLRCLRDSCVVRHGPVEGEAMHTAKLLRGESIDLRVERALDLQLADAKP